MEKNGISSYNSRFYTGQQAANLDVLFKARSVDLDRRPEGTLFSTSNVM